MNPIFEPMPLALPEPVESQLQRFHGVEPWMLAESFEEVCDAVHQLPGRWLDAFEKLSAIVDRIDTRSSRWDLLWNLMVRQVGHYSDGRIAYDEMKRAWHVLQYRHAFAAYRVATDAVEARAARRRRAKWRREYRKAA